MKRKFDLMVEEKNDKKLYSFNYTNYHNCCQWVDLYEFGQQMLLFRRTRFVTSSLTWRSGQQQMLLLLFWTNVLSDVTKRVECPTIKLEAISTHSSQTILFRNRKHRVSSHNEKKRKTSSYFDNQRKPSNLFNMNLKVTYHFCIRNILFENHKSSKCFCHMSSSSIWNKVKMYKKFIHPCFTK